MLGLFLHRLKVTADTVLKARGTFLAFLEIVFSPAGKNLGSIHNYFQTLFVVTVSEQQFGLDLDRWENGWSKHGCRCN